MDLGSRKGAIASYAITVLLILTLVLNLVCYVTVLARMRSVEQRLHQGPPQPGSSETKYHSVARIMMLFVFVYMLQYWAYAVFSVWQRVYDDVSIVVMWGAVFFSNMGGVFNTVAYTVLRRRLRGVQPEGGTTVMSRAVSTRATRG